jgi:hypothetical protein
MLKKLAIVIFVLSLFPNAKLCWGDNFNLRLTRWGMTQKEVINSEEKMDPVEITENVVKYKTKILKNSVELHYVFVDNKLIGAIYHLQENYLNSDHFRNTYTKFKNALIKKYGNPVEEKTDWINDTYKNFSKKWGLALSLGHVEYASSWKTISTTIRCSLREENYYVLCLIEYWSIEYAQLLQEIIKDERTIEIKPIDKMDPL